MIQENWNVCRCIFRVKLFSIAQNRNYIFHLSAKFNYYQILIKNCLSDLEDYRLMIFIFLHLPKGDSTYKICWGYPRKCVKSSSITESPWSGNDSAVNIFSSCLLMYKLFSVGICSTHIKHTVMSDCLCSKVITIGMMEHLSANNQKTLNVMSSWLKPFSSLAQGYMNIEHACF